MLQTGSIIRICIVVCLISFLQTTWSQIDDWEHIIRTTTHGDIRGYSVPYPGDMTLDVFVSVPYAKPPLGDLRFARTQEPDPWTEVVNATAFSPCCPQDLQVIQEKAFGPEYNNSDEDCLYLNVYAPRDLSDPEKRYDVMVWIHGGSYRYGSGEIYDSRVLAQMGEVVVVTVNYRLGVLGFLSTDDEDAPGNYGMLDQVMALQWVQDNIATFGGNPSSVTIFGNSAGGASVSLLMFSGLTEGLMHRAIPQSGSALSPWSVYRPPNLHRPKAVELAEKNDCPTDTNEAMLACLREKDPFDLVHTSVSGTPFTSTWVPRIDGYFLADTPEILLRDGKFHKIPLLSGTVPDENSLYHLSDYPDGITKEHKEEFVYDFSRRYGDRADLINDAILHEYDLPGDDPRDNRDLCVEFRTDTDYTAPHNAQSKGHSDHVMETYLYSFQYRSENNPLPEFTGVSHLEECYYTFGTPFWEEAALCPWGCHNIVAGNRQEWTEDDKLMSIQMIEAWTNFAKTGDPSLSTAAEYTFPTFDRFNEFYTILEQTFQENQYYKYKRIQFWNTYRPRLLHVTVPCP